jgi:3-dehydrotetronate 4-kinase
MTILLGAVADDFTGATDLASMLVTRGMRTLQTIGVPDAGLDTGDAEAVIVALKSRTSPVRQAVDQSLDALSWLRGRGARQLLFKYCSTFDSTADGNIGPVADALMDALKTDFAYVCPAFPTNRRTIYQGHLFVGDQLLSDSPMKDHPLTPMHDSSLVRLMAAQTKRKVGLVPWHTVMSGKAGIAKAIDGLRASGVAYGVADAITDDDLEALGAAAMDHALITGGSGIALALPENFRRQGLIGAAADPALPDCPGRAAVLAGSCSQATRGQVARARAGWPNRKIDANRVAAGGPVAREIVDWAAAQPADTPVLIYSSADPDEVAAIQARYGRDRAGAMLEETMGAIAKGLIVAGVRQLVVAGGETAGAVVSALGVTALRIGPEIDPGVPWTEAPGTPRLALALKSGNFGGEDFFAKALNMLR